MIDITIIFAYLTTLLAVGIIQRSNRAGFKGFSRISDRLRKNKLMLVATIFASSIGGGTAFGIAEKAFAEDISYTYALLFAISIDILIAIYIVPRLVAQHHCSETIGDIMSVNYGKVGRYISGFSAILVSIGFVATQISVSGRIFEYILEVNHVWAVIISYSIVIIYTTTGGFRSVLFTNQLQFFCILLFIPVISIFGIYKIGIENFIELVPLEKLSFHSNNELFGKTVALALGFAVMNLYPTFIQRALINKDSDATTRAIYIKSAIYAIFLIFITLNGLVAFIKYPEIEASMALPYLVDHMLPVGLKGIVVVGLLAAVMSTADSDLNITSITLVKDFFHPIFRVTNQDQLLMIAKIVNVVLGSISIIIALCFSRVVDLVIFISGFWSAIALVPLVFSLFNITISKIGFVCSTFAGLSSFILWEKYMAIDHGLKGVFVGTIANLTIFMMFYCRAWCKDKLSLSRSPRHIATSEEQSD